MMDAFIATGIYSSKSDTSAHILDKNYLHSYMHVSTTVQYPATSGMDSGQLFFRIPVALHASGTFWPCTYDNVHYK
jgi:hypothetical protein